MNTALLWPLVLAWLIGGGAVLTFRDIVRGRQSAGTLARVRSTGWRHESPTPPACREPHGEASRRHATRWIADPRRRTR